MSKTVRFVGKIARGNCGILEVEGIFDATFGVTVYPEIHTHIFIYYSWLHSFYKIIIQIEQNITIQVQKYTKNVQIYKEYKM